MLVFKPQNYTQSGLKVHMRMRNKQIANMKKELGINSKPSHQDRWSAICKSVRELKAN